VDITTATPAEIDAELANLGEALASQLRVMAQAKRFIERHQDGPLASYYAQDITRETAVSEVAAANSAAIRAKMAPYNAEYIRRGAWTRYFLVDSDNGHVHSDASVTRCSRTENTLHYWLTSESGRSAEAVVADAGERACTLCFPWAPAVGPSKYIPPTVAAKLARQAEKAAKAAKRAEKAITNPDGTPLRINLDGYWETIETVATAQRRLVDIAFDAKYAGRKTTDREISACQVILTALSAKLGTDVETLKIDSTVRLIKKCKREGITY
jgi:cytochrome c551/c552